MEFHNKVAVITGGASGIGRSLALALADLGTDIVIADIDDFRSKEVKQEINKRGRQVLTVHCDVSNDTDVEDLATKTLSIMGHVDILVTSAGVNVYGIFEKMTISDYQIIMNINFLGTIRCVLAFLPYMIEKKSGHIITVASSSGLNPIPQPYPISKYALVGYSEGLYCYLKPKGIKVSVLCPGLVNTNLRSNSPLPFKGNEKDFNNNLKPNPQVITPADVIEPEDVARVLINALEEDKFLILTHQIDKFLSETMQRGRDILKLEKYIKNNF